MWTNEHPFFLETKLGVLGLGFTNQNVRTKLVVLVLPTNLLFFSNKKDGWLPTNMVALPTKQRDVLPTFVWFSSKSDSFHQQEWWLYNKQIFSLFLPTKVIILLTAVVPARDPLQEQCWDPCCQIYNVENMGGLLRTSNKIFIPGPPPSGSWKIHRPSWKKPVVLPTKNVVLPSKLMVLRTKPVVLDSLI